MATNGTERPLAGRIALVTGANEGIGQAIAERLASDGAAVAVVARDRPRLDAAAAAIRAATGATVEAFTVDLVSEASVLDLIDRIRARLGPIGVLVNCASATRFGTTATLTDDEWVQGFQVKVFGALRLMKAAWQDLVANKGSIVNIGGVGARTPRDSHAMTGPLTAALMALTKVMADRGVTEGVQVNLVSPAGVRTPRFMNWAETQAAAANITVKAFLEDMARRMGFTRLAECEDVANMVGYIVSPAGSLLQGSLIDLDGGMTKGL